MAWFEEARLGTALGVVTGGTGLGIIVTGLLLPYLLSLLGGEAWRQCWLVLALITLLVAATGWVLLKERPSRMIPPPRGSGRDQDSIPPPGRGEGLSLKVIFVIYFLFGFAYNIYATYFVAFMVEEVRLTEKAAGNIWAIFGWMCMGSGLIWGFLSDRMGRRKALLWNNSIIAFSVFLPLLLHRPLFLGLSALLFGATFLGTVTVIAAAIGDQAGEKRASVYGLVTLIHGIGQFLGTTLGGYLKELTGSFQLTLTVSLTGFLFCIFLAAFAKRARELLPSLTSTDK